MQKPILPGLKITFLAHVVVGLFFGLIYLFAPEWWGNLIAWPVQDVQIWRTLGAVLLAIAASSWLGYRASRWEQVKIVVQMEIVWTILGALVTAIGVLQGNVPTAGWLNALLLAVFAVAFIYFYMQQESA